MCDEYSRINESNNREYDQSVLAFVTKQRDDLRKICQEAMEAIAAQTESIRGPLEEECSKENRKLAKRMRAVIKASKEQPPKPWWVS